MSNSTRCSSLSGRHAVLAVIALLGVAAIIGSGGGFPELSYDFDIPPSPPSVVVSPSRVTVEVGGTVQFRAISTAKTYQWQRDGVNIAGATSQTYSLVGVNLGDDGARFSVVVTDKNGSSTATGLLQVSPLPGVAYEDNFDSQQLNWTVTAVTTPAQADPKLSAARSATGGNPGAFMQVSFELPAGPSLIRVIHSYLAATYDPAQQGAIYGIDMAASCQWTQGMSVWVSRLLEQAGRRYAARGDGSCVVWLNPFSSDLSLRADEFVQFDGPECAPGESCPDFSVQGEPIRFGLLTSQNQPSDPAKAISYGIDNWKVTVWRN